MSNLIFLKTIFKEVVWGGQKLKQIYHYPIPSNTTGECWGISAHSHGDCEIINGIYQGKSLSWLWENHREVFGNFKGEIFPLLIKIIDAQDDLSIQVHPDDIYANQYQSGSLGKTECWLVLDCEEGASIIIGHHAKSKEELKQYIQNQEWNKLLREIPIKKGDFFQIEPGTLHAIKKGTMILETQQNSDITFRVYDYNRLQNGVPRQIHMQESIDCIQAPFDSAKILPIHTQLEGGEYIYYIQSKYYIVEEYKVISKMEIKRNGKFICVGILDGEGLINGISIKKGDFFIIPFGEERILAEGNLRCICSTPVE